uniref:Midkine n=1 Tax=Ailuropoda melanoleuca TaxID=9646 RepID=A0A7N5JHQ8_AILME
MQARGLFLFSVLILLAVSSEAGKIKKDKVKKNGSDCEEWRTLKKALYNAECQETIQVTKPCSPKAKSKSKARKGKGKD